MVFTLAPLVAAAAAADAADRPPMGRRDGGSGGGGSEYPLGALTPAVPVVAANTAGEARATAGSVADTGGAAASGWQR